MLFVDAPQEVVVLMLKETVRFISSLLEPTMHITNPPHIVKMLVMDTPQEARLTIMGSPLE